jgi:decaprenyl-phosphate phosphoribosyltransferase
VFLGVFLVKYKIEFLLSLPLFAVLFVWYLHLGMQPHSVLQTPEKLYRQKSFVIFTIVLSLIVMALFFIDLPWLQIFVESIVTLS